jgi:hypothetical protein
MITARHFTALIGTTAAASALGLAALFSAGAAGASSTDEMFMSVLADEGIQAPSRSEAVSTAYDVCSVFDGGGDLYDAVSAVSDYTELETEDSAYFVGAAVATYCPEHTAAVS